MKVLRGDPFAWDIEADGSAITIGVYDGIHLGHREVLTDLQAWAGSELETVVLTFDRHPRSVVVPDAPLKMLTTEVQRLELLADLGVDTVGLLPFSEIRMLDPARFAERVLADALVARLVVVGADFRFGRDRAGDTALLRDAGARLGFELRTVPLLEDDAHQVYSSTVIRRHIMDGQVAQAATLLGRTYEVRGIVIRGDGRGRTLGVPTANVSVTDDVALPARGVYAVVAAVDGDTYRGIANMGVRPTFGGESEVLEAHLFDFDKDLYGRELAVRFVKRIRDERAFAGVEDLVAQIEADIHEAKVVLSGE